MCARRHPRKADDRREAIRQPRHPLVIAISTGHDGCHGKYSRGMSGRKRTAVKRRLAAAEECVVKRLARRHIDRALSTSHRLHCKIHNGRIGISLATQDRRVHLISVMPRITCDHERCWHRDHFRRRDVGIESIVHIVQLALMVAEVGHGVLVGRDEDGCSCRDGQSRHPMLAFR